MTTTKPVVVGIKDKQPAALRFGLREARRAGVPVRVVHSAALPVQAAEFYTGYDAEDGVRMAGQQILDEARHFVEQEVAPPPVSYELSTGSAFDTLVRVSAGARLLVIGSDDLPWYERALGAAVAGHITRHADCVVVVVPEHAYPKQPVGGVVVTLDGDTSAAGPLRFAFEQADAAGHTLHVLHAAPPATLTADVQAIRVNIAEVLAGWAETYPDVRVMPAFVFDDTDDAIVEASQHAELVVVGRPHSRTVAYALSRPLATKVVGRAHCPVAIVPADYAGA
ncbi:universal stress protein [Aeromicrobium sp. A1-2]|uniref:universal stress protein n=1 Tax=Aeromicrobium sp. A1-2 TaxID=2107713 RepID=UPI0013C30E36|nr:universal stress protein [Aeromicrobium sp. A1-2]